MKKFIVEMGPSSSKEGEPKKESKAMTILGMAERTFFLFAATIIVLSSAVNLVKGNYILGAWQSLALFWMIIAKLYEKERNEMRNIAKKSVNLTSEAIDQFRELFREMAKAGLIDFNENGFPWHKFEDRVFADKKNQVIN